MIPKNILVTWHFAVRMFATAIEKINFEESQVFHFGRVRN